MKKIFCIAILLAASANVFPQSGVNLWIGKYHHQNDIGEEYFMLEVFQDGDSLKGRYREIISAQTTSKFKVDIKVAGSTASFYLAGCLPLSQAEKNDGGRNDCVDGGLYTEGDLMLKLRRSIRGKKAIYTTTGGKLTEVGFAGELDFVKTAKFLYPF
jgi:hypothetical protein